MTEDNEHCRKVCTKTYGASWYKRLGRVYVTIDCGAHNIRTRDDVIDKAREIAGDWVKWKTAGSYRTSYPNKKLALVIGEVVA